MAICVVVPVGCHRVAYARGPATCRCFEQVGPVSSWIIGGGAHLELRGAKKRGIELASCKAVNGSLFHAGLLMAIATVAKPRLAVTMKTQLLIDRSAVAGNDTEAKQLRRFQKAGGLDWNLGVQSLKLISAIRDCELVQGKNRGRLLRHCNQ